ncbi:MAG: DAK2 domain-containing protein, partial [bacterium]|nr:DAK2 domain-containing protein [bacterium]
NKNIIMAAEQVNEVTSKNVVVVASKSIPQGLASMLTYEPDTTELSRISKAMARRMGMVKTGQVTFAVKSYPSEAGAIIEGDIMGLYNGTIKAVGKNCSEIALLLLKEMVTEDDGVISIFYGSDIAEEEALRLKDDIEKTFPHCQIDFCSGGQPLYYYIFSVE